MAEPHSPSSSPEAMRLVVEDLRYGGNGPYCLTCSAGECIGVNGPSGVGKTLLLRALADLDPHQGAVLLDGRNCRDYPAPSWRRLVALVPAESRWWHSRVGAHLPSDYRPQEAAALAEACGFSADVYSWQVHRLSTGEKQRLSVIRTLIRKPVVLLLDETGASLDDRNKRILEQLIDSYRKEHSAAIIWVSHDHQQLVRVSGRVVHVYRDRLEARTEKNNDAGGR